MKQTLTVLCMAALASTPALAMGSRGADDEAAAAAEMEMEAMEPAAEQMPAAEPRRETSGYNHDPNAYDGHLRRQSAQGTGLGERSRDTGGGGGDEGAGNSGSAPKLNREEYYQRTQGTFGN